MGLYLYGIVRATSELSVPKAQGVDGAQIRLLHEGSLAAIVSDLPEDRLAAERSDLMAHSEVLQEIVSSTGVLPMRFGTFFASANELVTGFLQPNYRDLEHMLDRLQGTVEVQVKGEYDPDVVARDIVANDRTIQKLQLRAKNRNDLDSKVEVGHRFASLLDQTRYADGRSIVEILTPLAFEVAIEEPPGEYGVVNASFLVPRKDIEAFYAAVDRIREASARVRLRCLGPLPPYSFVDAGSMAVR